MQLSVVALMLSLAIILTAPAYAILSRAVQQDRRSACALNLSELWKMQHIYMVEFGGRMKGLPPYTGEAFWLALGHTKPPLIDPEHSEIFRCPVKGKNEGWGTHYRAPPRSLTGSMEENP
jgi:hypothetical protein